MTKTGIFAVWVAFFLVSGSLPAQVDQRPVSLLVHVNPNGTWTGFDETHLDKGRFRMGIAAGLRLDYNFEKYYALSLGVQINQTGGSLVHKDQVVVDRTSGYDTLIPGTRLTYRLQYLEIPLAIKFMTPRIGYKRFFLETGLDLMFNTRALLDATDNNISKEPFQQGVGVFNLGYHAGLGFRYMFGQVLGMQAGLYYKNTFLDVTRENDIRKPDNTRLNEVGITIGLTI
jgi:hypothetical protein